MFAALCLALASVVPHPNSFSSSVVRVDGGKIAVELRCQARSLVEAVELDANGDGALDASELERGRAALAPYLAEHYRVFADPLAEPLRFDLIELAPAPPLGASDEPFVLARLEHTSAASFSELSVRCTLFVESNPLHRDTCTVVWNGGEEASWLFPEAGAVFRFVPDDTRRPGVFRAYVELGVEHILTGWDHLAFLLTLLLAAARLRTVLGVVSAFTLSHSITLALASFDVVRVDSAAVEMAIALSIAYVAVLNLVQRRPTGRWLEAFGFGLVHGLGFASSVADALLVERLKTTALVGFNLGVELGQVAVVLLAFAALRWLPGRRAGESPGAGESSAMSERFLAPEALRKALCIALMLVGLWLFVERTGWLDGVA